MLQFNSTIDVIIFIIEVIGCLSFATSGAITAIRKKADLIGIWILTIIETFGGGLLRDLIINQYPPKIFWDPEYLILVAFTVVVSTIWYFIAYFQKTASIIDSHRHDLWIYLLDAIGIAVFCLYGVQTACSSLEVQPLDGATPFTEYFYIITLGVLTGVGGGMFRDVFIGEIPNVFRKHFYIIPCIIGTTVYALMFKANINNVISIMVGLAIIVVLRTFAIIFKWNLPSAKGYNKLQEEKENK